MAEQRGLFTALEPLAEAVAQHRAASPRDQNFTRASWGAFLLTGCAYTARYSPIFLGDRFEAVMSAVLSDPLHPPAALVVWIASCALGLLWLWIGVRGARGPRDVMTAFWAAVRMALVMCALLRHWYPPRDWGDWIPLGNLVLRGVYFGSLAEGSMQFLLAARGPGGGSAQKMVRQQIAQNEIVWRGVKRR